MTTWVLLRGLAREARHWGAFPGLLAARLPAGHRVIALDLPGNGSLHAMRSPATVAGMAEALNLQLAAQGEVGPFVGLGLSLGGMVALEWAALPGSSVRGLVLVNTSAGGASPLRERLRLPAWGTVLRIATLPARRREPLILELTSSCPQARGSLAAAWTAWAAERPTAPANTARQLWAAAWFRRKGRPAQPGLLLASHGDRLVSPACSEALARLWGWPLDLHPWAGHDLALDAPAWLASRAAAWAAKHSL